MISSFTDRSYPARWLDEECVFCKIIERKIPAFILYENEDIISFLGMEMNKMRATDVLTRVYADILPIRPGHALVVPKSHIPRVTDLPPDLSRALGEAISKVGDAITKGKLSRSKMVVLQSNCRLGEPKH